MGTTAKYSVINPATGKIDRAIKVAAKMKAYEAYCQRHRIPDPDFEAPEVDPAVVDLHGQALAWAEEHWHAFLDQLDDEDSQFLIWLNRRRATADDIEPERN